MVRTETPSSAASAGALIRPRACSVMRSDSSRLARMKDTLPRIPDTRCQLSGRILALAREAPSQTRRTPMDRTMPIAASLLAGCATGPGEPAATQQFDVHDFDFIAGEWDVLNRRLEQRGAGS